MAAAEEEHVQILPMKLSESGATEFTCTWRGNQADDGAHISNYNVMVS